MADEDPEKESRAEDNYSLPWSRVGALKLSPERLYFVKLILV